MHDLQRKMCMPTDIIKYQYDICSLIIIQLLTMIKTTKPIFYLCKMFLVPWHVQIMIYATAFLSSIQRHGYKWLFFIFYQYTEPHREELLF